MDFLKAARKVVELAAQRKGESMGADQEALVARVARGMESLLKTFTVGHAGGTAAPGNLSGGAALVASKDSNERSASIDSKKARRGRSRLEVVKFFLERKAK